VVDRLNEFGCTKSGQAWNCADAKKVCAFCNGPACPQSPIAIRASRAIRAMTREGFPAEPLYRALWD
jgi:hypothetical protein